MITIALAILLAASTAIAADITVDLGTVTVPDAQLYDVSLWLQFQPNIYTQWSYLVTNNVGGTNVVSTNTANVLISETAREKATRTFQRMSRANIRSTIRAWLSRRSKLAWDADPIIKDE